MNNVLDIVPADYFIRKNIPGTLDNLILRHNY